MHNNPRDWRIDDLLVVAKQFGIDAGIMTEERVVGTVVENKSFWKTYARSVYH